MKKIKKKALIFYSLVGLYILITVALQLYKYEGVIVSYFFIPLIWIFTFIKNPPGKYEALSELLNKPTKFTAKDVVNTLLFFLLVHVLIIVILISFLRFVAIDEITNVGLHLSILFLDLAFWIIFLFLQAILKTFFNDWS